MTISDTLPQYDVAIVGAGIVGLATAYEITQRYPDWSIVVLEKEDRVGAHQTGHNSGVLHSGVYYTPGSLKAENCRNGKEAMETFCREQGIAFEVCGKVIVALSESELPLLEDIYHRGKQNGVSCEMIDAERLHELEPHAAGIRALHVPDAGIVDYRQVCNRLAEIVGQRNGSIILRAKVSAIHRSDDAIRIDAGVRQWVVKRMINCAGLHSDRVTLRSGTQPEARIVPFRGEYFELTDEAKHLCRNLIYPVPNPNFPFLGVHFTRCIDGRVECGPNAVLAFAREGYKKTDINFRDIAESLTYSGFLRLALRYWRTGAGEMWRSVSKRAFVKALQRLIPEIRPEHLVPAPAGVRAQAVRWNGKMVDDFVIQRVGNIINVGNAPSPAATSSLNIGKTIVDELEPKS